MLPRPMLPGAVCAAALLVGCAVHGPVSQRVGSSSQSCEVLPESGSRPLRTVTITVHEPFSLDSGPVPANPGERLAMRQLYETLVRRDCAGRFLPALATRWVPDSRGEYWTFTLKSDPRRAGVSAASVRSSWERRKNGGLWPWPGILDVEAPSPTELRVRLAVPSRELPPFFADPDLAVSYARPPGTIAGETGIYHLSIVYHLPTGPMLRLHTLVPVGDTTLPILRIEEVLARADDRDLLDVPNAPGFQQADLLLSGDTVVINYARARGDFRTVPLPWERTYVLMSNAPLAATEPGALGDLQRTLVRDVAAEVRVAEPPYWWTGDTPCATSSAVPTPKVRVAYQAGDATARVIAERIAALAGPGGRPLGIAALSPADFGAALATGDATAFIVSVPRIQPATCRNIPSWTANAMIIPLVDARLTAVVRKGVPAFTVDGDGAIRFASPSP